MSVPDRARSPRAQNFTDHLELRIPSHPRHIAPTRVAVEQLCAKAGFERRACEEIGLVVNEALANIIRHAYNGDETRPIELVADVGPDGLSLTLRDWGSGAHPIHAAQAKPAPQPGDVPAPGGLGLMCMRRLMDDVVFEPQPDGMLLRLRRRRRSATPSGDPGRAEQPGPDKGKAPR